MTMIRLLTSTALVLAMAGLADSAGAQTASPSGAAPPPAAAPAPSQSSGSAGADGLVTVQKDTEMRANTLIGARVRNPQDENIGKIQDLVLDQNGSIAAAVVSVGGFLGIGDKHVAVPWQDVKLENDGKSAVIAMNKEQLKAAPEFKTKEEMQADRESEAARQRAREQTRAPGQTAPAR